MKESNKAVKYPGKRVALDGNTAVIMCERESTDAAGAYPITPSTQMGEYWAEETAKGHINISERPLIFIEPEGEHAAAAVTAGLSMTGLRATNFSSGQGIAYMHESLYAAVGKRLTYVLNMGCRAITKASLNVHAGHDDYHAVDDTGFFQVFGKSAQEVCDLNIISHRIAELALTPGIVAQDGFLTTHLIESLMIPERELIAEYLGRPDDIIDTPTPAQRMLYGDTRRRIPELWDVDNPVLAGPVQNQDAYMQSVASQRPYFFDHIEEIMDQAFDEYAALTGRKYSHVSTYKCDDADYILFGQGSVVSSCEVVADYLRETRGLKVGVVNLTVFRPFPGDIITHLLKGRKGVTVLERTDQPLAEDLPLMREIRSAIAKSVENGTVKKGDIPFPGYELYGQKDIPPLYSGAFGLGSRDLQPEGVIAAVENMLKDGEQRKFYYLSVDFIHEEAYTPKQEIHQQEILEGYPHIKELSLRGSENPNLMPENSITVRFHSVGGWGAITTGKNLAMTLFDLLGFHIKANPKYGSEKKGQPTTYYLSAAPEQIRINCEYFYVDCVLSPDPNVFKHSNPLAGLKKGGVFIIQSDLSDPADVWQQIPPVYRRIIAKNEIKVFYLDAFKVAREEAADPELQFRMQGNVFQGAFFAVSNVREKANLDEAALFDAIEKQLQYKFGAKGARVVQDNIRVVRRGYDEVQQIIDMPLDIDDNAQLRKEADVPVMLKALPEGDAPSTDVHRFWEQTGNFYLTGQGGDNLVDPFIGLSLIPAATGVFRDMTQIRFEHPEWVPENCTACGNCYTICPDSAIPGLVHSVADVIDTTIKRMESRGVVVKLLRRYSRTLERNLRALLEEHGETSNVNALLQEAIAMSLKKGVPDEEEKEALTQEFEHFARCLGSYKFSITKPYYSVREKQSRGSGGLISITVNPYTCKGCMECINVCDDDALRPITQTPDTVDELQKNWDYWMALPTTSPEFIRIDDLDEKIGALETLLLDKNNYQSIVGGDGACVGCGEKTVTHLFLGTIEALMQPRVHKQVKKIKGLIESLEKHIRMKMADTMDLSNTEAVVKAVEDHKDEDLTLSNLSASLDEGKAANTLDPDWLKWNTQLLAKLKHLVWQYTEGITGNGRASTGIINSTGCTSVWGSTYPYNPYPFPWANHLFQDSTSMAMGIFEGHMSKMAEGFKAVRMAEAEIAGEGRYDQREDDLRYFNWKEFTDEEFLLCPPVLAVGGDGAMYDIGFQNLSRMMMSGKPIKVFVLDTQVYSNTGGQACTSGFTSQVSDMAQYGKAQQGKEEIRKEIALVAMGHRTTYVLQGSMSNVTHLIEGYIDGLNARRPALFNIYAPCMPEHGIADDMAEHQSKLAVESRAYPLIKYNPDAGITPDECFDLEGNPNLDDDYVSYTLKYVDDEGEEASMELPLTFADFAVTEGRFRKQFQKVPRDAWNENMVPLAEYLELDKEDREDLFPYIWGLDKKNQLMRIIPAEPLVIASEDRMNFWKIMKSMAGLLKKVDPDEIANTVRAEMSQSLAATLMNMAAGEGGASLANLAIPTPGADAGNGGAPAAAAPAGDFDPAWIDTNECTSCDECIKINSKIFAYNESKKAFVKDPKGGPYKDVVRAAEKCTAQIIHPGTPADPNEKGVDKLVKRAEKFN